MVTKTTHQKQERMKYLRKIQKAIINHLYETVEKEFMNAKWRLAIKNKQLLNTATNTFFFKGQWWPHQPPNNIREYNKILDSSLYKEAQEILDNYHQDRNQTKHGIEVMLGNFLSVAGHKKDLQRLFPDAFQGFLSFISEEIFNIQEPLSDEDIQVQLKKNQNSMRYLKRLLMTQLLMKKTG